MKHSCKGMHNCSGSIQEGLTELFGGAQKCFLKEENTSWSLPSRNMGKVFQGFIHLFKKHMAPNMCQALWWTLKLSQKPNEIKTPLVPLIFSEEDKEHQ